MEKKEENSAPKIITMKEYFEMLDKKYKDIIVKEPPAPEVPVSPWVSHKIESDVPRRDIDIFTGNISLENMYKVGTLINEANSTFGKSLSKEDKEKYFSKSSPAPQLPVSPWLPYTLEPDVINKRPRFLE